MSALGQNETTANFRLVLKALMRIALHPPCNCIALYMSTTAKVQLTRQAPHDET